MDDRLRFEDSHEKIYCGDARDMHELPDESVQMVCCSPPYWGLRKYKGNQDLIWGDKLNCEHNWVNHIQKPRGGISRPDNMPIVGANKNFDANNRLSDTITNFCNLCSAWRGAYGLEPTPELYIQHSIEILREIRRVLRKDGVVFWDIGDSYISGRARWSTCPQTISGDKDRGEPINCRPDQIGHPILKDKDLGLIPFRIAISAQEDGWWLRSIIIWQKENPMPESVKDRPTESQEYILMLTKNANYYWDTEAVREPYTELLNRWGGDKIRDSSHKYIDMGGHDGEQHFGATSMYRKGRPVRPQSSGRNLRSVWTFPTESFDLNMCEDCGRIYHRQQFKRLLSTKASHRCHCSENNEDYSPDWDMTLIDDDFLGMRCNLCGEIYTITEFDKLSKADVRICVCGSNKWLSHFAVFPQRLPEICIKAATPEVGCCDKCGKPWERIIEHKNMEIKRSDWGKLAGNRTATSGTMISPPENKTIGWWPSCKCNSIKPPVPSIVLDPFMGSGTTLFVAKKMGRKAVGYDLSEEYCKLAIEGNRQQALTFNQAETPTKEQDEQIPLRENI